MAAALTPPLWRGPEVSGLPPPPLGRLPGGAGTERALEEAEACGTLSLAGRRLRAFPAAAARRWDLSDTTQTCPGTVSGRCPRPLVAWSRWRGSACTTTACAASPRP
uniref:Uncharacterized protein n=1 Tax=Corvus moneduloides TaxID=1196302 RepID=A0A8U7NT89_CORMO